MKTKIETENINIENLGAEIQDLVCDAVSDEEKLKLLITREVLKWEEWEESEIVIKQPPSIITPSLGILPSKTKTKDNNNQVNSHSRSALFSDLHRPTQAHRAP